MRPITDLRTLSDLYEAPRAASPTKVARRMTPLYRRWIEASRFVILTTVGPEGTDASPRGDAGPVVRVAADGRIHLPDWRGNNRLDSLRNIVRDDRVSLMFLVPGSANVVRVNGSAIVTADAALCDGFAKGAHRPRTVIVATPDELYFHCAKAIMRAGLWSSGNEADRIPSAGELVRERDPGFDAESYDAKYGSHARERMWS